MTKNPPLKFPGKYGPGVLNPDDYEAAKEAVETGSTKYGPGVLGKSDGSELPPDDQSEGETDELEALKQKYVSAEGYLAIKDIKALLEEMPQAFDRIFAWELARADGPRIGALQHLLKIEEAKEAPRSLVTDSINAAITKARGE